MNAETRYQRAASPTQVPRENVVPGLQPWGCSSTALFPGLIAPGWPLPGFQPFGNGKLTRHSPDSLPLQVRVDDYGRRLRWTIEECRSVQRANGPPQASPARHGWGNTPCARQLRAETPTQVSTATTTGGGILASDSASTCPCASPRTDFRQTVEGHPPCATTDVSENGRMATTFVRLVGTLIASAFRLPIASFPVQPIPDNATLSRIVPQEGIQEQG